MNLSGFRLIAAPFTPMRADGSPNLEVVNDQASRLTSTGVQGAFIGGTSGEGQSLTIDERVALAEAWAASPDRSKLELFVHVGHNCQDDAMQLARHAESVDADAVAMHAPTWFKQLGPKQLIEFCVPIAQAGGKLPFFLYDMPRITGVKVSSAEFLRAAKQQIPTLAGVKYTNPDCVTAMECVQANGGGYDILWGSDEALLVGLAVGASGAVGSTYNFAAPLYLRLIEAVEADDWQTARELQAKSIAMVRVLEQLPTLAALKFMMTLVGVDCGPVRAPLANLSALDQRQLRSRVEQLGVLEFAAPSQHKRPKVVSSPKSA